MPNTIWCDECVGWHQGRCFDLGSRPVSRVKSHRQHTKKTLHTACRGDWRDLAEQDWDDVMEDYR